LIDAMQMFKRMASPFEGLLERLPLPGNARFERGRQRLDETIYRIIADHLAAQRWDYDEAGAGLLGRFFHHYRCPVGQHFGNSLLNVIGVVAHPDDGVGAALLGMLDHQLKCLFAGVFAQLGVDGDIATEQGLDPTGKVANDAAGTYRYAPDNAKIPYYPVTFKTKCSSDH
jgi:hypothetical protein